MIIEYDTGDASLCSTKNLGFLRGFFVVCLASAARQRRGVTPEMPGEASLQDLLRQADAHGVLLELHLVKADKIEYNRKRSGDSASAGITISSMR